MRARWSQGARRMRTHECNLVLDIVDSSLVLLLAKCPVCVGMLVRTQ